MNRLPFEPLPKNKIVPQITKQSSIDTRAEQRPAPRRRSDDPPAKFHVEHLPQEVIERRHLGGLAALGDTVKSYGFSDPIEPEPTEPTLTPRTDAPAPSPTPEAAPASEESAPPGEPANSPDPERPEPTPVPMTETAEPTPAPEVNNAQV